MGNRREQFRSMLDPHSLFWVEQSDLRSLIRWATGEMDRLAEELRASREDRRELREEIARLRSLLTQRSEAAKQLAAQILRDCS